MTSASLLQPDRYRKASTVVVHESGEPLLDVEAAGLLAVPVYHLNGWSESERLYARRGVVERLLHLEHTVLRPLGVRWLVWDAWRSRATQCAIYQHYWREMSAHHPELTPTQLHERVQDFVTLPVRTDYAPPHTTGGAVDLGLWDVERDVCVELGADFDEFTPRAALRAFDAPGTDEQIRRWRQVMFEALDAAGFSHDENEYFHKDFGNQRWAAARAEHTARYGEVVHVRQENTGPRAVFAAQRSRTEHRAWVAGLAQALDLSHPAHLAAPPLQRPTSLAQRWLRA